ncbi:hypothetical protein F383_00411 [Gossypium arboreum]|uniref:Uncharacterized protein n=1 Tax=Gossypium arboreum TaxID=29729 RepID=A0A0B0P088_GOSAR|nr:hypothetical protein F383_00411 [Gossypium arboreum]
MYVIRESIDKVPTSEKPRTNLRNRSYMCFRVRPCLGHRHCI